MPGIHERCPVHGTCMADCCASKCWERGYRPIISWRDMAEDGLDIREERDGKVFVIAFNEGGYNCTGVDLRELLQEVLAHPELNAILQEEIANYGKRDKS